MIINTEKLRYRRLNNRKYIAVYGTQDNPYSSDYDLMDACEANNAASNLDSISDKLKDEAERLRSMAGEMAEAPKSSATPRRDALASSKSLSRCSL